MGVEVERECHDLDGTPGDYLSTTAFPTLSFSYHFFYSLPSHSYLLWFSSNISLSPSLSLSPIPNF